MKLKGKKQIKKVKRTCPKCRSIMVHGVCPKCHYSAQTAYKSRREAKEYTYAGD